jgi:putative flavoprotein involved in K+ transport
VEIRPRTRVRRVEQRDGGFVVEAAAGAPIEAAGVVAASGSFTNPYRPHFLGQESFTGDLLHVAECRNPARFEGRRVVVVGAGDSAAQVANELAPVARVTLATRHRCGSSHSAWVATTFTTGCARPGLTRSRPPGSSRSRAAA